MAEWTIPSPQPRYPEHLINCWRLADGRAVTVRPVRTDDGPLEQEFVRSLSPRTRYYRFFNAIRELSPDVLHKLTHIDYRRQMTLVAVIRHGHLETQVGAAEYAAEMDSDICEFAVAVNDAWQGLGLGRLLIESLIGTARAAGYARMEGEVMADNYAMLNLCRALGFDVQLTPRDDATVRMRKLLNRMDFDFLTPRQTYAVPCAG
jgi:acetyltransferase